MGMVVPESGISYDLGEFGGVPERKSMGWLKTLKGMISRVAEPSFL